MSRRVRRALVAAALLVAAMPMPSCVMAHLYASDWPQPSEAHRVVTEDGWELDLRRVPASGPVRRERPVVLLHGIVTNGRNMDLDEEHSLARHLARDGFDVWVPSLRGVGHSEKGGLFADKRADYGFDEYAALDLPAILRAVREKTGAAQVDYVGHSMGGLVLYAYLSSGGDGIGRAVTLGSPALLRWSGRLEELVRWASPAAGIAGYAPIRAVSHATLPLQGEVETLVELMLWTPGMTDPDVWRRFVAVGTDDVPPLLLEQFAGWIARGAFDSRDGSIDYLEGLRNVRVPMLVVAGKLDGIAPPWSVRPAYERLASEEKRFIVIGEANGMSADYNHMDMLLGERAAEDVFSRVSAFLAGSTP